MLNEFNRIARQMLFLHGHLVRPTDWAQTRTDEASSGHRATAKPPHKRTRRFVAASATSGLVTTTRLIVGQLR